jgi:hypothetical protein
MVSGDPVISISIVPQKHLPVRLTTFPRLRRAPAKLQCRPGRVPAAGEESFQRLAILDCRDQPRAPGDIARAAFVESNTFAWPPLIG